MKLVPALSLVTAVGIGATAWVLLDASAQADIAVPKATPAVALGTASVQAARRACVPTALDAVVQELAAATQAKDADRDAFHRLAEAHLERALVRSHRRGLVVGTPTWSELPRDLADDIDRGLAAVLRARELGDQGGDLFRIEAALLSQRITGITAAMQWNGRIQAALKKAGELIADDPQLHVALGLRKLLAPKFFGHDAAKALEHFEFAAKGLVDDERPAVFAAMATWLQQKRQVAIGWLEQAVARNPQNEFARVVLRRLRAGEADPFGREVTAAEAAATK
jgi:tetratricopeptide (TPR) repeat protein